MVRSARNIPLVERPRTIDLRGLIEMCDEGRYAEAWEAVEDRPDSPEKRLICGASQMAESPEVAKDSLSQAARLLDGELAERALIWLGMCYWAIGEKSEARATLEAVGPTTDRTRLLLGLNRSIIESNVPALAMTLLDEVSEFVEFVAPLLRGKFLVQRGFLLRRTERPDEAIIAYEEAKYWFAKLPDPSYVGTVANNLASVYSDLSDFEQAHQSVNQAIDIHKKTGRAKFLSDAYDQKAQIYIKQKSYLAAEKFAAMASEVLLDQDQKETRARALITEADALSGIGRNLDAIVRLERAQGLAEFLANQDLIFDVIEKKVCVAESLLHRCDADRINLALEMSGGSFRVAAKKLATTHPRLSRLIKKYDLQWNGNKPLRSILKRS